MTLLTSFVGEQLNSIVHQRTSVNFIVHLPKARPLGPRLRDGR